MVPVISMTESLGMPIYLLFVKERVFSFFAGETHANVNNQFLYAENEYTVPITHFSSPVSQKKDSKKEQSDF